MRVLVESRRDRETGMLKGYSENYIPVLFAGNDERMNQVVEVEVTAVSDDKVFGEISEC
jgi:threonylcarbamoyladenosine tRNA methylthiotransferase MtaB